MFGLKPFVLFQEPDYKPPEQQPQAKRDVQVNQVHRLVPPSASREKEEKRPAPITDMAEYDNANDENVSGSTGSESAATSDDRVTSFFN